MTTITNVQVRLASRPTGMPTPENFQITEMQEPLEPARGVRLKTIWLSIDPYMRARMSSRPSYTDPTGIGDVMPGGTVSQVVASTQSGFQVGDFVVGYTGWQAYADSDGSGRHHKGLSGLGLTYVQQPRVGRHPRHAQHAQGR